MNKQQLFVLISTFIVGAMCGAYLYVTAFAPVYTAEEVQALDDITLRIQAERYGGCSRGGYICDSFQLLNDRTYKYIPSYRPSVEEGKPVEGRLSRANYNNFYKALEEVDLEYLARTGNRTDCQSMIDLVDTAYRVELPAGTYELDSCNTNFSGSELESLLEAVWQEVVTGEIPATNFDLEEFLFRDFAD